MDKFEKGKLYYFDKKNTSKSLLYYDKNENERRFYFTVRWAELETDRQYIGKSLPWSGRDVIDHINELKYLNRPGRKELIRKIMET